LVVAVQVDRILWLHQKEPVHHLARLLLLAGAMEVFSLTLEQMQAELEDQVVAGVERTTETHKA
jgi:hypothetical protein